MKPMILQAIASSRRRFDPDAMDYFDRIAAAGSSISSANKNAVNAFVVGCKADGIWSALKASCILAGADDLTGALVPLVGPAPTNVGFVAGNYSRTTGLKGSGVQRLDTGYSSNADLNAKNLFACVWITESDSSASRRAFFGSYDGVSSVSAAHWMRQEAGNAVTYYLNSNASPVSAPVPLAPGCIGYALSGMLLSKLLGGSIFTETHDALFRADNSTMGVFSQSAGSQFAATNSRLGFYGFGEALDLALLDARLTALMASLT